jgi:serine/threonine-protein kinase
MSDAQSERFVGTTFANKYRIVKMLGEGGMGCVYLGEQMMGTTVRKVAVKTLHQHLSQDEKIRARFMRECSTVAELEHPNTIQVFDFGSLDDGTLYIVMEFVQGQNLADILEQTGPMRPERAVNILRQVCGSLEEAHGRGIVHRDLKPENIVLCEKAGQKDWVEVLDFGIAKRSSENDPNEAKLTQQGMVLGTPPYMSPEQFTGKPVDARSDLYSLGVMAYEMLVGKLPFHANTAWEWATQHMTVPPQSFEIHPESANIPPAMKQAIMRCLAKDAGSRFANVQEFFAAFSAATPSNQMAPIADTNGPATRARTELGAPMAVPDGAGGYGPPPGQGMGGSGTAANPAYGTNPGAAAQSYGAPQNPGYGPPTAMSPGMQGQMQGQPPMQQQGYGAPPQQMAPPMQAYAPQAQKKGGGSGGIIIAGVLGLVVVGGGAGAFVAFGRSKPADVPPPTAITATTTTTAAATATDTAAGGSSGDLGDLGSLNGKPSGSSGAVAGSSGKITPKPSATTSATTAPSVITPGVKPTATATATATAPAAINTAACNAAKTYCKQDPRGMMCSFNKNKCTQSGGTF